MGGGLLTLSSVTVTTDNETTLRLTNVIIKTLLLIIMYNIHSTGKVQPILEHTAFPSAFSGPQHSELNTCNKYITHQGFY